MGQGSSITKAFRLCAAKLAVGSPVVRFKSPAFLALASLAALAASFTLSGCGEFFTPLCTTNCSTTGGNSFVYVSNTGGTVTEYSLVSGVLTQLSGSPISPPLVPTAIAISPNNSFLYVGTATGVFLYNINSDGTLTEGNNSNVAYLNTVSTAIIAASMVVDSTNSWLIIAYRNTTNMDVVQLDSTTGLPTGNVFYITSNLAIANPQLAISAANTQVFVALGTGGTQAFPFNPNTTT